MFIKTNKIVKKIYLLHNPFIFIIFILIAFQSEKITAQGCVAVRQMGGVNPLSTSGYTLPKGQFQIGTSYRYFHSFRHFAGTEEQLERQPR